MKPVLCLLLWSAALAFADPANETDCLKRIPALQPSGSLRFEARIEAVRQWLETHLGGRTRPPGLTSHLAMQRDQEFIRAHPLVGELRSDLVTAAERHWELEFASEGEIHPELRNMIAKESRRQIADYIDEGGLEKLVRSWAVDAITGNPDLIIRMSHDRVSALEELNGIVKTYLESKKVHTPAIQHYLVEMIYFRWTGRPTS